MAYLGHRTRFNGEIDNKTVRDLKMLDYNITNYSDRNKHIEDILGDEGSCRKFYDDYVDKFYKSDTTNELSEDINVFKSIEQMATYLLNSSDLDKEKKQEYKIYNDEQLFRIALMENNGADLSQNIGNTEQEQVLHYLLSNRRNEYYKKDVSIQQSDFKDSRIADILNDYNDLYEVVKKELNNIKNKNKSSMNLYQARNMLKTIKDDMILAKQKIIRPIDITPSGDFSTVIDWDQFDFTNKEHIKAVLYIEKEQIIPNDDVSLIVYDVNRVIGIYHKNGMLDDTDIKIIKLIRLEKSYTLSKIGELLNISQQAVSKRIDKISEKIAKFFR